MNPVNDCQSNWTDKVTTVRTQPRDRQKLKLICWDWLNMGAWHLQDFIKITKKYCYIWYTLCPWPWNNQIWFTVYYRKLHHVITVQISYALYGITCNCITIKYNLIFNFMTLEKSLFVEFRSSLWFNIY